MMVRQICARLLADRTPTRPRNGRPSLWTRAACTGVAGFGIMVLAACGDSEPAPLSARVDRCADARVHDSGHLVYVTVEPACSLNGGTTAVTLGVDIERNPQAGVTLLRREGDSTTEPVHVPGLGQRAVQLVKRERWRQVEHQGTWGGRDGAGLLALGGAVYLLGGWLYGPTTNEVWRSYDLVTWEFLGYAPWPARHGAAWLVHGGRLFVIGGDLYDDVWSSADGANWTLEAAAAPFGARYTPNAASVQGRIVVYAGQDWTPVPWCTERPDCAARGLKSVWRSTDGRQWEKVVDDAPWAGRGLIHGHATWNGEIYLIGGGLKAPPPNERYAETVAEFADIWSSPDGERWVRRAPTLGFAPRTHFSVVSTEAGCYVSDGSVGTQMNVSNDLFYAPDCVNFRAVPVPAQLPARHASSLLSFNGSLVLIGGPFLDGAGSSVWQYFP